LPSQYQFSHVTHFYKYPKHNETAMKEFLKFTALLLILISCQSKEAAMEKGFIHTVNGKIDIGELGFSLTHEHVMSAFGAEPKLVSEYDKTALFDQVLPYVKKVKGLGVTTIFDCTTAYFGRDVELLKEIANSTGIRIVTNTGFYGAAKDKYVPEFAFGATPEEISKIWIEEFENGIDNTGIKPGFVKLAFDNGSPSDIDIKLFEAGLITHIATGLTLAVHTGDNEKAVKKQLELLNQYKVNPRAWVWVHAHKSTDIEFQIQVAQSGAWVSLDGIKEKNLDEITSTIVEFKKRKLLNRLLLSHDGNSFNQGRNIRPYDAISTRLIPQLKANGLTDKEINQLMVENPKSAFGIRIRKLI
jgi:predicted metal-dependent phosphotriesterase family hydrolase